MVFSFLAVIFFSLGNIVCKYISLNFNIYKTLFFQYVFVTLLGFIYLLVFWSFSIDYSLFNLMLYWSLWFFWYLAIWAMLEWMKYLSNAIVLIISYSYVFLCYFINSFIFSEIESFSFFKLILATLFFISISIFLVEKDWETKEIKINKKIIFPILTAVGWTIYYTLNNYFIKTEIFSPTQWIFYSEFFILIFSTMAYIWNSIFWKIKIDFKIGNKQFLGSFSLAVLFFLWILSTLIAYKEISWNLVNFIGLFSIISTAILSLFIFKDKLIKKQIIAIWLSFIILTIFIY